jgi:hypothetical protein|tara:strand:+ start:211 stop:588 length:378 start_codon:yes stop_codon:yes gene_type:complete
VLRAEPELFAMLQLVDRSRQGSISFGVTAKSGPWKCPAQHWANVIAGKAGCLTALDLSGNRKAPLTALKACLRAVPPSLKSLNLDGVESANLGTLKEARARQQLEPLGSLRRTHSSECGAHRLRG